MHQQLRYPTYKAYLRPSATISSKTFLAIKSVAARSAAKPDVQTHLKNKTNSCNCFAILFLFYFVAVISLGKPLFTFFASLG